MAKGIYVGVGGVARKVKQIYVGVSGVAKKVKKVYVGVNGLPRLTYSSGLEKIGVSSTPLPASGLYFGASVGNYALFTNTSKVMTPYSSALVKGTSQNLTVFPSDSHHRNMSAKLGNRVLMKNIGDSTNGYNIDAVSDTLVKTNVSLQQYHIDGALTSNPSYAVCIYGEYGGAWSGLMEAFNTNLVRTTSSITAEARKNLGGVSIGDYAVFVGGDTQSGQYSVKLIEAYNSSLVKTTSQLAIGGVSFYIAKNMSYAILNSISDNRTQAINGSLVSVSSPTLTYGYMYRGYTSTDDYAVYGGSFTGSVSNASVETIDRNLVKETIAPLSSARYSPAGVTVGNKVLFAGGNMQSSSVIDVYEF